MTGTRGAIVLALALVCACPNVHASALIDSLGGHLEERLHDMTWDILHLMGCFQSCTAVCSSTSSLRQNITIDVNNPISIEYGQKQSQALRQNQTIGQTQSQNQANVALPNLGTAGSMLNTSNVKSFAAKPNTQAAEGHSDWIKASEAKESNVQGHTGFAPGSCSTVAKRVCQKACAKPHDHMLKTCSELCNGMDVED